MVKRIRMYAKILGIIYGFMLVSYFADNFEDMRISFIEGVKSAGSRNFTGHYFFSVSPKGGEDVYPITEIFDGKEIHYKATHIVAKIDHDEFKDGSNIGLVLFEGFGMLLSLPMVVVLIYIPILFYKITNMMKKGELMNRTIIRRVKRLGWLIIGYFLFDLILFRIGMTIVAKQFISLENYTIRLNYFDTTLLMLGVIILFFGDVIKMSLEMKEDQELTI